MMLAHPELQAPLELSGPFIASLVVEEPRFLRRLITDLSSQLKGEEGPFVLSHDEKILAVPSWVELITDPLTFEMNSRPLLGKIASAMEHEAVSEGHFLKTAEILQNVEQYIRELAFSFDCDIRCGRCTPGALLKAVGVFLEDDYEDPLERLTDYMELVREFDRDKLFVLPELRRFFTDEEMSLFLETLVGHSFRVLLIESTSREKLPLENRVTIDTDLCEF